MLFLRSQLERKRSMIDRMKDNPQPNQELEHDRVRPSGGDSVLTKLVLVLLLLISFALTGCEEVDPLPVRDQPVWFEYHYINYAWGYRENGWLMDNEGNLRYYSQPDDYRTASAGGYLGREDLEYNLAQTDSAAAVVDRSKLETYVQFIPGAAEGEISIKRNIAADAGSSVLSAYLYDVKRDSFQYVFLGSSGDWEQFNESEEANSLVAWLRGFDVFWLSE